MVSKLVLQQLNFSRVFYLQTNTLKYGVGAILSYDEVLRSEPTPTFSHTVPSIYTPSYKTPNTWDCITVISDFPDIVPAHPLDILPRIAPEPVTLRSLMRSWPYTTHRFTEFHPRRTDGDLTELWLAPQGHFTHAHNPRALNLLSRAHLPDSFPLWQ